MTEKEKLTPAEQWAYGFGANMMWSSLNYARSVEGMDFESALNKIGRWMDDVLKPWAHGDLELIGHHTTADGFPVAPNVKKLD
jgi:hypothetical protein